MFIEVEEDAKVISGSRNLIKVPLFETCTGSSLMTSTNPSPPTLHRKWRPCDTLKEVVFMHAQKRPDVTCQGTGPALNALTRK